MYIISLVTLSCDFQGSVLFHNVHYYVSQVAGYNVNNYRKKCTDLTEGLVMQDGNTLSEQLL